jgi:hypothetical protein
VAFDSWYSSLENLKLVCSFGWHWLTQLNKTRFPVLIVQAIDQSLIG